MNAAEYASARATLGLSHDDLAAWLGVNRASSYKWESGVNEVPGPVSLAVSVLAALKGLQRYECDRAGPNGGWIDHFKDVQGQYVLHDDIAPLLAVRES